MRTTVFLTRIANHHQGELLAFLTEAMIADSVAPTTGSRRLFEHFQELAASRREVAPRTRTGP
jgi:hypothetical protein